MLKYLARFLFCSFFLFVSTMPAKSQETARSGEEQPLPQQSATVEMSMPQTVRRGETVHLTATFKPEEVPSGFYKNIRITWISRPEGVEPAVLNGTPKSDITFALPGHYVMNAEAGFIFKGSCGAVTYTPVTEQRFTVEVE